MGNMLRANDIRTKAEKLSEENQLLFEEVSHYIYSAPISSRQANQVLAEIIAEWLELEQRRLPLHVQKHSVAAYCQQRLLGIPKQPAKLKVAQALATGMLILAVAFAVQTIVQFIGFFDATVQATKFSLFPLVLLAVFGLAGIYMVHGTKQKKRANIWKVAGVASQLLAVLLFFTAMRLWDGLLTVTLDFPSSLLFLVLSVVGWFGARRLKYVLEEQQEQTQGGQMPVALPPPPHATATLKNTQEEAEKQNNNNS
ncbi:tripartite tricarboxylate transporter TctB family protein [Shouchella clausii]|uniref:tripartite tricarboxylate transporter TctB family protein n=1 Tax=Shouchella clausii TaxID=79880 RepID=UPI000BA700CF|nr:tripartite tricarboxylate transporter TctB family protein [Shouchella clausii]MBX0317834.1 tripartite tricarboxylate transporter TctB family protein [Shouchella clausii]PAE93404.1 hypothetical protein CHH70_11925 [Shouchella clausii]